MEVGILGTRGSFPVSGNSFAEFGGATTAYRIRSGSRQIFVDAGSGILSACGSLEGEEIHLFLTHTHIDHIVGLPALLAACSGKMLSIHGSSRAGESVEMQLSHLMRPPLWPVGMGDYRGTAVSYHGLEAGAAEVVGNGAFAISCMEGRHPGGVLLFRIEAEGKSVVLATDHEWTGDPAGGAALRDFARGADLLLFDGQYTDEEYEMYRGYGHSADRMGLKLMRESGAGALRIVHHDPRHGDAFLREREAALREEAGGSCEALYAREGEVIRL